MDDKPQRERLEQELRFLKESFEADVISREEFEKGKDRVERKLKEIKAAEKEANPQPKEEQKNDAAIEQKSGEKIKLKVIQDEEEHHHEHAQEPLVQIKTKGEQKETISYTEDF